MDFKEVVAIHVGKEIGWCWVKAWEGMESQGIGPWNGLPGVVAIDSSVAQSPCGPEFQDDMAQDYAHNLWPDGLVSRKETDSGEAPEDWSSIVPKRYPFGAYQQIHSSEAEDWHSAVSAQRHADLEERGAAEAVRRWVESIDALDAVVLMVDADSALAGAGVALAEELRADLNRFHLHVVGHTALANEQSSRGFHTAFTWMHMQDLASSVTWLDASAAETSGVELEVAAIQSLFVPRRLERSPVALSSVSRTLAGGSREWLHGAAASWPFVPSGSSVFPTESSEDCTSLIPLNPLDRTACWPAKRSTFAEYMLFRGLRMDGLPDPRSLMGLYADWHGRSRVPSSAQWLASPLPARINSQNALALSRLFRSPRVGLCANQLARRIQKSSFADRQRFSSQIDWSHEGNGVAPLTTFLQELAYVYGIDQEENES